MEPDAFPSIEEVARQEVCDFQLPLFDYMVQIRMTQVLEAFPINLEITPEDLKDVTVSENIRLYEQICEAVRTAYRLGLKDGLVRLVEI